MTDEEQIRALLDTYWAEWLRAGDPPDPNRQAFTDLLTGESLQQEVQDLQKKSALKEARRLPSDPKFSHTTLTVTASDDVATATECVVDDTLLVDTNDGRVLNSAVATYRLETQLARVGGHWRMKSSSITQDQKGVQPCGV